MVSNIYEDCSMCDHPYPYKCEECCSVIIEEQQVQALEQAFVLKSYVGSGEDFCPDTYFQSLEGMLT